MRPSCQSCCPEDLQVLALEQVCPVVVWEAEEVAVAVVMVEEVVGVVARWSAISSLFDESLNAYSPPYMPFFFNQTNIIGAGMSSLY